MDPDMHSRSSKSRVPACNLLRQGTWHSHGNKMTWYHKTLVDQKSGGWVVPHKGEFIC